MENQNRSDIEKVYTENAETVYRFLYSITQDIDLAEELTQETFYQAVKSIDHFRGDCKISVWLCQIAKHCWYHEYKRRKKETFTLEEIEETASDINIEKEYIYKYERVMLYKLLQNLNEKNREVMYLRITGEFSFAQIGEILGETENWARVTFYRGKQLLKQQLGKEKNE